MSAIELTAEEKSYIVKLLKEHVDYYRLLSSASNRAKYKMLERLMGKLRAG